MATRTTKRLVHGGAFSIIMKPVHEYCRFRRYCSFIPSMTAREASTSTDMGEFLKSKNGGGMIHISARVDPSTVLEIGSIVHSNAMLAGHVHVGSGTIIGPDVSIGESTWIGYNVSLSNCTVGDYCVIHNGACVGQDGFGFFLDEKHDMIKKPQLLRSKIGNSVEIGANTCIDRGSWRDTVIGDHTKIDNLVHIGHNVIIGRKCLLCGKVAIAGSATIGDDVTFGGRASVCDHVSICSKVRLAANSCVTKDLAEPGDYGGFPAVPIRQWRKQVAYSSLMSKRGMKT